MENNNINVFLNDIKLFNKIPKKYQNKINYINKIDGVYNIGLNKGFIDSIEDRNEIWADTWDECLWLIRRIKNK